MSGGLSTVIPAPVAPLVGPDGNITVPWRAYLMVLQRRTGGTVGTSSSDNAALIAAERDARIAADNALQAAIAAEAAARAAADAAEAVTRASMDVWLESQLRVGGDGLQAEIAARIAADLLLVPIAQLCALWAGCDLSFLPTSDPGLGKPWLNGTHLVVGTDPTITVDLGLEDGSGTWLLEDGTMGWVWG